MKSLQDIIVFPKQAELFANFDQFENSLLRFSEAQNLYKRRDELLSPSIPLQNNTELSSTDLSFTFHFQSVGFKAPHSVQCNFQKKSDLPHRMMAFVGKNGTGKTAVLAELAKRFSGISRNWNKGFEPVRPNFSRTIAISYSPFGPFKYPPLQTSSYRYCGILTNKGKLSSSLLEERIKNGLNEIFALDRTEIWFKALTTTGIIKSEPFLSEICSINDAEKVFELFKKMSSGHYYTALILTDIVSNLIEESILLIDEPELYLHPNILSGLMRSIEDLLDENTFNSYAIVATHSPIVIQEIPSRSIRVFSRTEDVPVCEQLLDFESFGENLTNIVNQVFGVTRFDKNYMYILERLSVNRTKSQINELFDNNLGTNALAYISALVSNDKNKK